MTLFRANKNVPPLTQRTSPEEAVLQNRTSSERGVSPPVLEAGPLVMGSL